MTHHDPQALKDEKTHFTPVNIPRLHTTGPMKREPYSAPVQPAASDQVAGHDKIGDMSWVQRCKGKKDTPDEAQTSTRPLGKKISCLPSDPSVIMTNPNQDSSCPGEGKHLPEGDIYTSSHYYPLFTACCSLHSPHRPHCPALFQLMAASLCPTS